MSRDSSGVRAELVQALVREVRQFDGLGASFFRVAAGRIGMNVTDLQVIDILDVTGPATAGRLAELTGLTTGAITGMLDRLEKDGYVRRERDPEDGRRVIVRLAPSDEAAKKIGPIFDAVGHEWGELAANYNDEQLTTMVEFLKRGNSMSRGEIARLRDTSAPAIGEDARFSTPLGDVESGRLIFPHGTARLNLRADAVMTDLYQAHFDGSVPEVKVDGGNVAIRYSRRQSLLNWGDRTANITLNASIPWSIALQGGTSSVDADLTGLDLRDLEIKGGMSAFQVTLPAPSGVVPIKVSGGASEIIMRHPAGVASRIRLKGWALQLVFDDESFTNAGGDVRLQTPGYEDATRRYDVEILGSASVVKFSVE